MRIEGQRETEDEGEVDSEDVGEGGRERGSGEERERERMSYECIEKKMVAGKKRECEGGEKRKVEEEMGRKESKGDKRGNMGRDDEKGRVEEIARERWGEMIM